MTLQKIGEDWNARHPDYAFHIRCIEIAAIAVFIAMSIRVCWMLIENTETLGWEICLALVLGFILADFISGLVHFWCDHIGKTTTPILGPIFVKHFLAHHDNPRDITEHDFVETNGNNFLASAMLLLPLFIHLSFVQNAPGAISYMYFSACIFLALTNQSHKWAHQVHCKKYVVLLQKIRILLPNHLHALHHETPHESYFCITSGILNELLEKTGFFRFLLATTRSNDLDCE